MAKKRRDHQFKRVNRFLKEQGKSTKSMHSKPDLVRILRNEYIFEIDGSKASLEKDFKRFMDKVGKGKEPLFQLKSKTKKTKAAKKPTTVVEKRIAKAPSVYTGSNFYESKEWLILRYKLFKKYEARCMRCSIEDAELHADHIKPRSKYPELELEFDNLQILCRKCNKLKSNKDEIDYRPYATLKKK
jgi:hypothetical protein